MNSLREKAAVIIVCFIVVFAVNAAEPGGTLHQWSFEGNADDAVGTADGVLVGTPAFVPGANGLAMHAAPGSYAKVPAPNGWVPGDSSFTIAWYFQHHAYGCSGHDNFLTAQGGDFAEAGDSGGADAAD